MIWSLSPKGKAVSLPLSDDKKTGCSPGFLLVAKTPASRPSVLRAHTRRTHARADERATKSAALRAVLDKGFARAFGEIRLPSHDTFKAASNEEAVCGFGGACGRGTRAVPLPDCFGGSAQGPAPTQRFSDRLAEARENGMGRRRQQRCIRAHIHGDLGHNRFRT